MTQPKDKKFLTASGINLDPFYFADPNKTVTKELPGEFPFTRGIYPGMYRDKIWTMRQYAGYGSAAEANKRYHYLLKSGGTGLSIAFDLPTQMGRDSDAPLALGEVGKVGVAVSCVGDMEDLLSGIPLDKVSISMTINSTAAILLAFLLVVAERRGISWDALNGTIQNDILKEYIARGTYIYPPGPALRIVTDIISFCDAHVKRWNTVSISGYHIREAGSTAIQEIAFTLANGIAYVEAAKLAGLAVDDFGQRLAFFFNCHNDFLEEIAKFRAARRLWAKIMQVRFGATNPRAKMLRFHTQTAGSSLTAQQPLNNVVRTTIQGLAAVLGGTQSLHTNSYDEAIGLPTEEAAILALRTQQVIAFESGVASVADPLGGSYLIEELTDRLEKAATEEISKIDSMGGMLKAIEQRYPQSEIEKAAYNYQKQIETGSAIVVGVNSFKDSDEREFKPFHAGDQSGHLARLSQRKGRREMGGVTGALSELSKGARGGHNIMELTVKAAQADATLGEISDCLRAVFGEYREGQ